MRFLNPFGLLGLLTIPIIIGLHLHLERNRRVMVSSMFLWQFLDAKFQGQKPRFVRFTWLLLLDISLAVLFTLALAKPQVSLPALGGNAVQKVILLDDSISMLARDGDPDRFSLATEITLELINEASRRDEVLLLTVGGDVETVGATDETGNRTLVQAVRELTPMGYGTNLRTGLAKAKLFVNPELPLEVYVITDGAYAPEDIRDFPYEIIWAFIGFEVNNQAVTAPVLEQIKDGRVSLFTRVLNFSSQQVDRNLEIWVNGTLDRQEQVTVAANAAVPLTAMLPVNAETVSVRLLGEDSLPEDDLGVAAVSQNVNVQVALVTDTPGELARALSAVAEAKMTVYAPGDVLPEIIYDLIIYRGVVPEQWPQGTVAVFDPPAERGLFSLGEEKVIQSPVTTQAHPILDGVSLENVRWETGPDFMDVMGGGAGFQAVQVLAEDEDQPLLLNLKYEDGDKLIFLPRLGSGNFTQNSAFPILVSNLVEYSRGFSSEGTVMLGSSLELSGQIASDTLTLQPPGEDELLAVAPEEIELDQVGLYRFQYMDALGENQHFAVGVNAGDDQESDIAPQEWRFAVEPEQIEQPIAGQMIEVNLGPWLLLAAVVLIILEAWRAWR